MPTVDFGGRAFRISRAEQLDLSRDLASRVKGASSEFSVHLVHANDDAALLSLQNTSDIFGKAFGNDPKMLLAEYGEMIPHMSHIVILDRAGTVAASTSVTHRPASLNKTILDTSREPWNVPVRLTLSALGLEAQSLQAWDLTTIAVTERHRSGRLSLAMLQAAVYLAHARNVSLWTAILDSASEQGFRKALDPLTQEIPGTERKPYFGSKGSSPLFWRTGDPAQLVTDLPWLRPRRSLADVTLDAELQSLRADFDVLAIGANELQGTEPISRVSRSDFGLGLR